MDTFDLYTESPWPTTLYHADGITPLSDTDGDGQPDTGPVDQGSSKSIVVRTQLPAGATVGAGSAAQVTAISSRNPTKQKGARFQATIPAPFASSYSQSGQTTLGYYRPGQQTIRRTGADNSSGYDTAAATLPDGRIVQVWAQGRNLPNNGPWVNELHYALTDNKGNVLRAAARLTDLSGADSSRVRLLTLGRCLPRWAHRRHMVSWPLPEQLRRVQLQHPLPRSGRGRESAGSAGKRDQQ